MIGDEGDASTKGYGKHSKTYWLVIYIIGAVIVYGIIYLLFFRKTSGGGSFKY